MGGDLNKVTFELVLEQRMVLLAENGGVGECILSRQTSMYNGGKPNSLPKL